MAGARITKYTLLAGAAFPGGIRVTHTALIAATAQPGNLYITNLRLLTAVANRPGKGLIVTNYRYLRAQSIHRRFWLGRLGSTSRISPITQQSWTLTLVAGPIPEFNPYKPQVPESLLDIEDGGREIFDWLEEQQKTIRLQHNITQSGDTTFPFQMIINAHDEQQFTLGAVGKFYHEDYGIIHARYVQYEKMNLDLTPTAPVGLIKNTAQLDWIVTNRLEISDPHLVVGVQASYTMPTDGQFGWVTVDGVNLQPIDTEGTEDAIGTPYVWSASGKVGPEGEGVVICRRLQDGGDAQLLKGRAFIRLEGASFGSIDVHLQQLYADVAQLKEDVLALQEASDIEATIKAIQASLKVLGNRITSEENARRAADTAINNRIDGLNFVTGGQLNAAIAQLEASIASLAATLNARIDATHAIALEALQKANQALAIDIGSIQSQISDILVMITNERVRVKGKFPVVDGDTPPNLVYLEDGSLVYTETF